MDSEIVHRCQDDRLDLLIILKTSAMIKTINYEIEKKDLIATLKRMNLRHHIVTFLSPKINPVACNYLLMP